MRTCPCVLAVGHGHGQTREGSDGGPWQRRRAMAATGRKLSCGTQNIGCTPPSQTACAPLLASPVSSVDCPSTRSRRPRPPPALPLPRPRRCRPGPPRASGARHGLLIRRADTLYQPPALIRAHTHCQAAALAGEGKRRPPSAPAPLPSGKEQATDVLKPRSASAFDGSSASARWYASMACWWWLGLLVMHSTDPAAQR
jgi:hypothetical protein